MRESLLFFFFSFSSLLFLFRAFVLICYDNLKGYFYANLSLIYLGSSN